jgi:surface protein
LSWTAPASDGGSAITDYKTRRSTDNGTTWSAATAIGSTSTSTTISDLTAGDRLVFQVAAVNGEGDSAWSDSSAVVVVGSSVPNAPSAPSVTVGTVSGTGGAVTVTVAPPSTTIRHADNGLLDLTSYEVKTYDSSNNAVASKTCSITASQSGSPAVEQGGSCQIPNLTLGGTFTFTVIAKNSLGSSEESAKSASVQIANVPSQPSGSSASASTSSVTLQWSAPASDGGSAITGYKTRRSLDNGVTWSAATATGSSSPSVTIAGFNSGDTVLFQVAAVNAAGDSVWSGSTMEVTVGDPMVLEVDTRINAPSKRVALPLSQDANVKIKWGGDGRNCPSSVTPVANRPTIQCDYNTGGVFEIKIYGSFTRFGTDIDTGCLNGFTGICAGREKITAVKSFGTTGATSYKAAFEDAVSLKWAPSTLPNTVTDIAKMFKGALSFNADPSNAVATNIGLWDTSRITDLSSTFEGAEVFNQAIGNWDTGNVTTLHRTFSQAKAFNQPINSWNVSKVTKLSYTFAGALKFNQSLNSWNTAEVTTLFQTFSDAEAFNSPISNWDVSKVTDMSFAFLGAKKFDQPLNSWNVANVTRMWRTFALADVFNQPLNQWDTSKVEEMTDMFFGAKKFNQNIGTWDTGNVTKMSSMFEHAAAFNSSINSWNVAKVVEMNGMFYGATAYNQSMQSWNTASLTGVTEMFRDATSFNQSLSTWNFSNITSTRSMFFGATAFNQDLSAWDTRKVTEMEDMFTGATSFNQNITTWNTGGVVDMSRMFLRATAFNQDISTWNTGNVVTMHEMFSGATSFNQNLSGWCVAKVVLNAVTNNAVNFATGATAWTLSDSRPNFGVCPQVPGAPTGVSGVAGSTTVALSWTAPADGGAKITDYQISVFAADGVSSPDNSAGPREILVGSNRTSLTITGLEKETSYTIKVRAKNIKGLSTSSTLSSVISTGGAMTLVVDTTKGATGTTVSLPLSSDAEARIDWGGTGTGCPATISARVNPGTASCTYATNGVHTIKIIGTFSRFGLRAEEDSYVGNDKITEVKSFGDTGATSYFKAFKGATNLTTVATSVPSTVTTMEAMFDGASRFNSSINSWDVSHVTNMDWMFSEASAFNHSLDNWNTANVTSMQGMFAGASAFNQSINSWNTGNVQTMSNMFERASAFNQPLASWDTSRVRTMGGMFDRASSFNQSLAAWCVSAIRTAPIKFDADTTAWVTSRPNWSKCPTVPNAPTSVTASFGTNSGDINLNWSAPTSTGEAPIVDYYIYLVTADATAPSGFTQRKIGEVGSASTAIVMDGFTTGTSLTFRVTAVNAKGESVASASSNSITAN